MDSPDAGRLSHIYQLSGFADPVYAEACVTVHDYDIVLEVWREIPSFVVCMVRFVGGKGGISAGSLLTREKR